MPTRVKNIFSFLVHIAIDITKIKLIKNRQKRTIDITLDLIKKKNITGDYELLENGQYSVQIVQTILVQNIYITSDENRISNFFNIYILTTNYLMRTIN